MSKLGDEAAALGRIAAKLRAEFPDLTQERVDRMAAIAARAEGMPPGQLRPPKVKRKKGMHRMNPCGGCSATVGMPHPKVVGLYTCGGCGGLVGNCYLGDFHGIVKPRWCADPNVPQEQWRYYDVTTLGSKGSERHHGYFDKNSGCILQTG